MTRLARKQRRVSLRFQPVQLQRQIRQLLAARPAVLAHPPPHRCQTNSSPIEILLYLDPAPLQPINRASRMCVTARAPRNPETLRRKFHRPHRQYNPRNRRQRHHRIKIKRRHVVRPRKHVRPNPPQKQKRPQKPQRETQQARHHRHAVVRKQLYLLHVSPKWSVRDPIRPKPPAGAPKRLALTR